MSLFHPALFFLSGLFGGGIWTRILHPWLGLALVVTFTGLFLRFLAIQFVCASCMRPGRLRVCAS
jgi:cytochrome b subunit of formate dehydrogenase